MFSCSGVIKGMFFLIYLKFDPSGFVFLFVLDLTLIYYYNTYNDYVLYGMEF